MAGGLRDSRSGNRVTLLLPETTWEEIESARKEFVKLREQSDEAQRQLTALLEKRQAAKTDDVAALATAIRAGKPEPKDRKTTKVDTEIVRVQERIDAIGEAVGMAQDDLIAAIAANREQRLEELDTDLDQKHATYRQAVTTLGETREAIMKARALRAWYAGFPDLQVSYRQPTLPVRTLKNAAGQPMNWGEVLAALEQDLVREEPNKHLHLADSRKDAA